MTSSLSQRTKKSLVLFLLIIFGLFFLFSPAEAVLGLSGREIAAALISNIILFLINISIFVLGVASAILNWVLSEKFINFSYTNPATNPVIQWGWTPVRDLTNMFFLISLVFIGLATALKLKEYQAKKALPRLIAIALLINFTPVICGVIVDASNIITYYLLEHVSGIDEVRKTFEVPTQAIVQIIKGLDNWEDVLGAIMQAQIISGANFFTAVILLLFAFLFALRYVAIWIAVILSPLAFFSYIFPTLPIIKDLWEKWWNQFLQWCFVGVIAAFFLYLGNKILIEAPSIITAPAPGIGIEGGEIAYEWSKFFGMIVPSLIGVLFLYLGFIQALATSAMGAKSAISAAKWTGRTVPRAGAVLGKKAIELPLKSEKVRKFAEKRGVAPLWGAEEPGMTGWMKRRVSAPVRFVGKAVGRAASRFTEAEMKEISEIQKKAKRKLPGVNLRESRFGKTPKERIGALMGAIETKQLGDFRKLGFSDEEIIKIGEETAKVHPEQLKKIAKFFPQLAERMGVTEKGDYESVAERLTVTINPKDISKLDPEAMKKLMPIIHRRWSGREIGKAAQEFGPEFVNEYMRGALIRGREWYKKYNPKAPKYLGKDAAQSYGLSLPPKIGYVAPKPIEDPDIGGTWIVEEIKKIMKKTEIKRTSEEKKRLEALQKELKKIAEIREKERREKEKLKEVIIGKL